MYIILKIVKVISTITISSNLKNETDMKIISALEVLDFFFDKKADINKLNSVYIRKAKSIIFVTRSIINHWVDIYILLFSLKKIIEPKLNRKFILFKFKKYNNGISLYLTDVSSINELPDFLKKEKISLKISFFFSKKVDKQITNFILQYFGFE